MAKAAYIGVLTEISPWSYELEQYSYPLWLFHGYLNADYPWMVADSLMVDNDGSIQPVGASVFGGFSASEFEGVLGKYVHLCDHDELYLEYYGEDGSSYLGWFYIDESATLSEDDNGYVYVESGMSHKVCVVDTGEVAGTREVARKVKSMYIGVDGTARKIKKAYIGIGGVARPCWGGGELTY